MREPVSLLDVFRPPAGWVFDTGVWVTHDLATTVLADLVVPALAGVADGEGSRRRALGRAELERVGARLTVLGCQGRITYGAATPAISVISVGGRRLHAKFGVLLFRPEAPVGSTKRRARAVVTSANLTRGGLLRNHEVLAWEESGPTSNRALAADLVKLLRDLAKDLAPTWRAVLRDSLSWLNDGVPGSVARTGRVHSSGLSGSGARWTARVKTVSPVDRLVIVTPAFASDHDWQAVQALTPLLEDRPVVDLYTALSPGTVPGASGLPRLVFSSRIVADLEAAAGELRVQGVPELVSDPDGDTVRHLHAKVVAAVSGSSARVWVGSANLTGRGFGGRNREVMLEQPCSLAALDRFLAQLGAVPVDRQEAPLAPPVEAVDDPPAGLDLRAVFWADGGQSGAAHAWDGELHLVCGEIPRGLKVEYEGQRLRATPVQRLRLLENCCRLDLLRGIVRTTIPVEVMTEDASFWTAPADDRPPRRQPGIEEFLADLRSVPARLPAGAKRTAAPPGADTIFRLPIEQRLVMVARARRQLHRFPGPSLLPRITEYLGSGTANGADAEQQVRVAEVLAAHATGLPAPADDPLLVGLSGLLRALDTVKA